jgi:DNA polymerase-3 subunit alpha
MRASGIEIGLPEINSSDFGFKPDVANNKILFGLKGILGVGDDVVLEIISNRPYASPKDFVQKVNPNKQTMISLIKGGAFDEMIDRKFCMAWYLWETCEKKKRLTLQNMPGLIKYNLLPLEENKYKQGFRIYEFNRYLKSICKYKTLYYKLDERAVDFLSELGVDHIINQENEMLIVLAKEWDKIYQKEMDVFRNWIADDKENILNELNTRIFKEAWDKYASGTISAWEMEVLCFYYHEHELLNVDMDKYGLSNFFDLPEEPIIDRIFYKQGKPIKLFKISKICGTCIAKDKAKSTVSLLTLDGVITVKFRKEYFSLFDKQISVKQPDGTKKVAEKSWFNRGSMIIIQGIRSKDVFLPKKYASTVGHQLYKITKVLPNGELEILDKRYSEGEEDE